MWGNNEHSVTVSDWVNKLTGPARRNDCLSAREVRQRAAAARSMADVLTMDQHQAVLDELPQSYIEGLVAMDRRYESETARLVGNHPKRIKMLASVEGLPYPSHWDLLCRASKAISTTAIGNDLDVYFRRDTVLAERAAIRSEAAAMVRLLTLLVLLSLAGRHKYPSTLLLALLWALGSVHITAHPVASALVSERPAQVLRPPGRLVLAEPRMARAPGRGVSLCSSQRGPRRAVCVRGNALAV